MDASAWIGSAVVAALISGIITAMGWYASHASSRRLEAARRLERIEDFQTALRAEIRSHRQQLLLFAQAGMVDKVVKRIEDTVNSSSPFTPFIPRDVRSFVFDEVVREIHILPTEVIDPIVYYSRQVEALRLFGEDLRSDRFDRLEPARKVEMYKDYVPMGAYALELATDAVKAIEN